MRAMCQPRYIVRMEATTTAADNTATTPGFNCRVTVEFRTDRNGRRFAQQWNNRCRRWVRCSLVDAELWVAQGLADRA